MDVRNFLILIMTVACGIVSGCNKEYANETLDDRAAGNAWMVDSIMQDQANAAIVSESTLYTHHFVKYGSSLNALGMRDLHVLATHFRNNPGRLNVRRGPEDAELYAKRVDTVRTTLASHGVDIDRIKIENGFPGGEGISASRALVVLERDQESLGDSGDSGGSGISDLGLESSQ